MFEIETEWHDTPVFQTVLPYPYSDKNLVVIEVRGHVVISYT